MKHTWAIVVILWQIMSTSGRRNKGIKLFIVGPIRSIHGNWSIELKSFSAHSVVAVHKRMRANVVNLRPIKSY